MTEIWEGQVGNFGFSIFKLKMGTFPSIFFLGSQTESDTQTWPISATMARSGASWGSSSWAAETRSLERSMGWKGSKSRMKQSSVSSNCLTSSAFLRQRMCRVGVPPSLTGECVFSYDDGECDISITSMSFSPMLHSLCLCMRDFFFFLIKFLRTQGFESFFSILPLQVWYWLGVSGLWVSGC